MNIYMSIYLYIYIYMYIYICIYIYIWQNGLLELVQKGEATGLTVWGGRVNGRLRLPGLYDG